MRLEIEGIQAEIGNQIIALSKKGFDIADITLRGLQISNKINLPDTQVNRDIFKSAYLINSDNGYMDKFYQAKIHDNFFIFNGIGFLNGFDGTFPFQLVEKTKEFLNNLNKNINKLDFEDQDFTFNYIGYNSYKLASSNLWIWPLVCMHETKISANTILAGDPSGLKYSRPMLRFKTILDKIFSENDWTISYDEDIIDSLAISCNHEQFFVTSYQKTIDTVIAVAGTQNLTGLNTNDFEYNVTTTSTTINIGSVSTAFRLRGDISLDADFTVIIKGTDGTGAINEQRFYFSENDIEIDIFSDKFETDDASHSVEIILEGTGNFTFDSIYLYTLIDESDFDDLSTNPLVGYRIKAYDNLPDKTQFDIFKEAVIFTNSVINPDSFEKTITFNSLKNLSRINSEDWSQKYVKDQNYKPKISNQLGSYAQKNWLKYNNDETISLLTGSDYFNINSEILQDEVDILTMPYSASNDIEISTYQMAHFNIYGYNEDDSVYERINSINNRVIYFYNDPGNTFTIGRFLELHWKNLKSYWQPIFDSLYRPRIIEADFNLKALDFYSFDFTKLVYILKEKSYFIMLQIDDFRPGELTKCLILKFK